CAAALRNSHRRASANRDARRSAPRASPCAATLAAESPTLRPSASLPRRAAVNAKSRPHGVDTPFGIVVHLDHVRPVAGESFLGQLSRRIEADFGAVGEGATRVIEHVHRT